MNLFVEDSLTKEVNKIKLNTINNLQIRPITTGIIDIKNKNFGRKNIENYVDIIENNNNIRPRAPLISRIQQGDSHNNQDNPINSNSNNNSNINSNRNQRKQQNNSIDNNIDYKNNLNSSQSSSSYSNTHSKIQSNNNNHNNTKKDRNKRNKKNKSIDVLWESLQHFSKNNLSRSLIDQDVTTTIDSPSSDVHFVNLSNIEEQDEQEEAGSQENYSKKQNSSKNKNNDERLFSLPREPVEISKNSQISLTSISSNTFRIPELPSGQLLTINILSTWGDPHYVGLMGIEIFDQSGHIVHLTNVENQIWANPSDINVLSEYGNF